MNVSNTVRAWIDATLGERIRAVLNQLPDKASLHPDALSRFLAAAATLPPAAIVPERPEAPGDLDAVLYYEEFVFPYFAPTVLLAALRTGRSQWQPFSQYAQDPAKLKRFMGWMDRRNATEAASVAAALTLQPGNAVLDVGGGGGALAAALAQAIPGLRRVDIYELPDAIPVLREVLARHHGDQPLVRYVGGSFLAPGDELQGLSGATYELATLSWILHDWNDEDTLRILERTHRHMAPGGRVAIVEVLKENSVVTGLLDLLMLLHTGGRERSFAEYAALLAAARFRAPRHHPLPGRRQLILADG